MAITKEQAVAAGMRHTEFHYSPSGSCDVKSPLRWRSNGRCKTWVTRPEEFRLPIKRGLNECTYLTHNNAERFHVADDCPNRGPDIELTS